MNPQLELHLQEFEKQNAVEFDDLARKRITIDHDAC